MGEKSSLWMNWKGRGLNEESMKMMKLMSNFCMCYTSSVSQKKRRTEERKGERKNTFPGLFSTPNYYILITLTSLYLMSESGEWAFIFSSSNELEKERKTRKKRENRERNREKRGEKNEFERWRKWERKETSIQLLSSFLAKTFLLKLIRN